MATPDQGVRFAPSPTGRFHVGNLRTAWVSRQWARRLNTPWIVRFEDIDHPRVVPQAQKWQLEDLQALGLVPDRILVQSENAWRHEALFQSARESGQVYPCHCSRREVQEALSRAGSAPHFPALLYSGHCRKFLGQPHAALPGSAIAWRFRMPDESGYSDFIVARTALDGTAFEPAYHWACAIDDFDGAYLCLVRASDLAHVAVLQRAIQAWLSELESRRARPAIHHSALITRDDGHRLEKRTQGVTLPELLGSGYSTSSILEKFEKSYRVPRDRFQAEAIWDEAPSQMTLHELGFQIGPHQEE